MLPKNQDKSYGNSLKPKSACSIFNLNDEVKILDLLKGSISL
jgi:hypothetical protein